MFSKKSLDYRSIKFKARMIIIGEIDLPLFFRNIEIEIGITKSIGIGFLFLLR